MPPMFDPNIFDPNIFDPGTSARTHARATVYAVRTVRRTVYTPLVAAPVSAQEGS